MSQHVHRVALLVAALLLVVLPLSAQGTGGVNAPSQRNKPYVVMVSVDGMRAEYLQRLDLPNVERIWRHGVRSVGMIPVFPSKTFPNHYSLVTGMYAENHGLVANRFWDPARRAQYALGDTISVLDGTWYRGEPLWVTAEKQGMVSASFFWVGSEAAIGGTRPTYYKQYSSRVPIMARVDTVLYWLGLRDERRPHLITLYFSMVDDAGHAHGPLSPQVDTAAARVDTAIGRLLDGIEALPHGDRVYVIVVSDHGMTEVGPRWFTAIEWLIDTAGVRVADAGANANLHVSGGRERAMVLRDSINRRLKHGRAYLREEVPARLHYRRDPRIGDVVVIMEDHFQIGRASWRVREGTGGHGWDPAYPSMHATFIARGPGIPAGKVIGTFENVDVYPWIAELLGLRPATNIDGKRGRLAELIRR